MRPPPGPRNAFKRENQLWRTTRAPPANGIFRCQAGKFQRTSRQATQQTNAHTTVQPHRFCYFWYDLTRFKQCFHGFVDCELITKKLNFQKKKWIFNYKIAHIRQQPISHYQLEVIIANTNSLLYNTKSNWKLTQRTVRFLHLVLLNRQNPFLAPCVSRVVPSLVCHVVPSLVCHPG